MAKRSKPLVSVIVTTKNEEANIGRLLESIKTQTHDAVETVVVDNNSTDKTKELASQFTKKVYTKGPERSAQRNYGVAKANGKYVLILDADMELTLGVIASCVAEITRAKHKALIVPEKTTGTSWLARVRAFEREMYMGDATIEVARFFEKAVFEEFGGYDIGLTGTEDYDLPHRISKKYTIGWAKEYILHHEEGRSLWSQLTRKYYYAKKSATYADKHPELVATQGNMLFRKAYISNWQKFAQKPLLGVSFIIVRVLETLFAVAGYISAVGFGRFFKTFLRLLIK